MNAVIRKHLDVIEAELPLKLVSGMNVREHWGARKRRAEEHRGVTKLRLQAAVKPYATMCAVITITRIAPRPLDSDNLAASAKHVRDGIADAYGLDDRNPRLAWNYAQERGRPKYYGVRIRIEVHA